jgi:hypothetical protein
MIADERFLGLADGLFDGMHLLRDIEAGPMALDHLDDAPQMPVRTLQALDNLRVTLVQLALEHEKILSSRRGS